ncbi:MAG: M15 family metallopeptidase [Myxococcota bacterium]
MTIADSPLVNVAEIDPSIVLDIRYATRENIAGHPLYREPMCLIHRDAAEPLARVQAELRRGNSGLKIFDAYRPPSAQRALWQVISDPRYVADPNNARHTRGTAVDVTLVALDFLTHEVEYEVAMPTGFDEMTERAHRDSQSENMQIWANRRMLDRVMIKHGFEPFATEWWHFDLHGWQSYPQLTVEDFAADSSEVKRAGMPLPL